MISPLAFLVAIAPAPMQPPPEASSAIESWTCTVKEQLDQHVSGMMQMLVYPDGARRDLAYYIHWADQPGYIAEQQASWMGIPMDATNLWKPDSIGLSVGTQRTDTNGRVTLTSATLGQISEPAEGKVRSLRPTFHSSWISIDDAYLLSRLWAGWPWEAKLIDRNGVTLGTQAILLPNPETAQAMFTRLRTQLDRKAADSALKCTPNLEPDPAELMERVI